MIMAMKAIYRWFGLMDWTFRSSSLLMHRFSRNTPMMYFLRPDPKEMHLPGTDQVCFQRAMTKFRKHRLCSIIPTQELAMRLIVCELPTNGTRVMVLNPAMSIPSPVTMRCRPWQPTCNCCQKASKPKNIGRQMRQYSL